MPDIDVVIVADDADTHAAAVIGELDVLTATTIRYNLGDLRRVAASTKPGGADLLLGENRHLVTSRTTVWWRRMGKVDVGALGDEEARLAWDEAPHALRGMFSAAGVRWVDEPLDVERAEIKLWQLTTASRLGVTIPATTFTNEPTAAQEFASGRRVVAKPLSPGVGIAPFVAEVAKADLASVAGMPTLLQELVVATADLRVVVVNGEAWAWRRPRGDSTVDWRAEDPSGVGFRPVEAPEVCLLARQVTSALRLTMSVQDWLETKKGHVFLEANPQGAWLFLPEARTTVAPTLAQYLLSGAPETSGGWPHPLKRILWDFRFEDKVPPNDGVIEPEFARPLWVGEVSTRPGALEAARRATDHAEGGAKVAEEKAARLMQAGLTLLAVALALGAFQLKFVLARSWPWILSLMPVAAAIVCLALASFEAIEIDRVGFYHVPGAGDLAGVGPAEAKAVLIAGEERGRRLATWTSKKKHSALMQARAWFSRGLVAVIVASLVAGIGRAGLR